LPRSGAQEREHFRQQLFRDFLGDVVPAWRCMTGHTAGDLAPFFKWLKTLSDSPVGSPQRQHLAFDHAALDIGAVVIEIDARAGSIVLAQSMRRARLAQPTQVFGQRLVGERRQPALRLPMVWRR
jgi:hypothetical protein